MHPPHFSVPFHMATGNERIRDGRGGIETYGPLEHFLHYLQPLNSGGTQARNGQNVSIQVAFIRREYYYDLGCRQLNPS